MLSKIKYKYTDDELRAAVMVNETIASTLRQLGFPSPAGGYYRRFHKDVRRLGIDTSHFTGKAWIGGRSEVCVPHSRKKLSDILSGDVAYDSPSSLKKRMWRAGIKERVCEHCGLTMWRGNDIPLQLHHVDGDRGNNVLSNLEIVCPNCHAQTDTYCIKNVNRRQ